MPGLDGLRAVAVAAVVAYHLGVPWAPGGLLGVGIFFTLSGYLITDILLSNWESLGSLHLRAFWAARARRLLPALAVMLAVVTVWAAVAQPSQLGALRSDVAAASVYVSNWWLILQHVSYFARFGPPAPLGHLWSLAVEEQFYLIWPWLLWGGLIWERRRWARTSARAPGPLPTMIGDGGPLPVMKSDAPPPMAALTAIPAIPAAVATTRRAPRQHWAMAVATLLAATASAVEMGALYHPSFDPSRVYDGTDTRAFAILFGAALAMVWPSQGLRANLSPGARRLLDGAGALGLVSIAMLIAFTSQYSSFVYPDGMVLLALATVLVVAAVAHPASRWGRLLGWRPLRWLGERSYGIYLWHYPVIMLTTPTVNGGFDPVRATLQLAGTMGAAELSWRFIETPVRHGAIGRLWAELRSAPGWWKSYGRRRWLVLCSAPVSLVMALAALAGLLPSVPQGALASAQGYPDGGGVKAQLDGTARQPTTTTSTSPARTTLTTVVNVPGTGHRTGPTATSAIAWAKTTTAIAAPATAATTAPATTATTAPATTAATAPTTPTSTVPSGGSALAASEDKSSTTSTVAPAPVRTFKTSCTEVVHIGDSTSESLVSSDYLPDAGQRLPAQYARVGVSRSLIRIQGGTSIVETIDNEPNAYQVAQALLRKGYKGCWVLALGTNDAADVYVGSNVGMAARINRMMSVIGDQPVLWVNVKTLLSNGPYSEANMKRWDEALVAACARYPNMRVFNWAGLAKKSWFVNDGIHYNSPGSAPRAAAIADALATAFPAGAGASGKASATSGGGTRANAHKSSCVINGSASWHLPAFRF